MSSLQYQYIVRYFQTWIEHETDPQEIEKFDDPDDDSSYDSESDSFEMKQEEHSQDDLDRKTMARRINTKRSSSAMKTSSGFNKDKQGGNTSEVPAYLALQPQDVNDFKAGENGTAGAPKKSRPRANTD